MIRIVTLLIALTLAHAAEAQTAPPPLAKPAAQTPRPAPAAQAPSAPKPSAPRQAGAAASGGPCIGVISHLGDFSVKTIGIVVFANDLKQVPVPAWGLDDLVIARVRAAAGPRANVRKIAHAPDAFGRFDRPDRMLFQNTEQDLAAAVQAAARTAGCARYVVVLKGMSGFLTTNQTLNGIGVVNYLGAMTYLFALTHIRVYDGRSFAILKRGAGGGSRGLFSGMSTGIHGPSRDMKGLPWPPPPDAMPRLRADARGLLAESLDKALPELLAQ